MRRGITSDAFIWGKGSGTSSLHSFITNRGAVVPVGWALNSASLISADGNTIYGWGFNPDDRIEMFSYDDAGGPFT